MSNISNENKGKLSTVFYHEWLDLMEDFTDEEVGKLLKAVLLFDRDGETTNFQDRAMKVAYKQMISVVSHNRDKYETICEKRRENINKRYQKSTNEYKCIQVNTNVGDNDNDNDSDNEYVNDNVNDNDNENDNDNVNDNDNDSGSGGGSEYISKSPQPQPLSENEIKLIIEAWNAQSCTNKIKSLDNDKRIANTKECIKNNFGLFIGTIRDLDNQRYLADRKINYDWFCNPENYIKVVEGNYKDIYGAKKRRQTREDILNM